MKRTSAASPTESISRIPLSIVVSHPSGFGASRSSGLKCRSLVMKTRSVAWRVGMIAVWMRSAKPFARLRTRSPPCTSSDSNRFDLNMIQHVRIICTYLFSLVVQLQPQPRIPRVVPAKPRDPRTIPLVSSRTGREPVEPSPLCCPSLAESPLNHLRTRLSGYNEASRTSPQPEPPSSLDRSKRWPTAAPWESQPWIYPTACRQ
jgi:hypothetical protein